MTNHIRGQLLLLGSTLLIASVLYPLAIGTWAGVAAPAAPEKNIGQDFTQPAYVWPRPSAASYNGAASSGSNWGASNPNLRKRAAEQLAKVAYFTDGRPVGPVVEGWATSNPEKVPEGTAPFEAWLKHHPDAAIAPVPADLVTASGSGLDPHLTLRAAVYQSKRIAQARGVEANRIEEELGKVAFTPMAGLIGEPLVNVVEANSALDKSFGAPAK